MVRTENVRKLGFAHRDFNRMGDTTCGAYSFANSAHKKRARQRQGRSHIRTTIILITAAEGPEREGFGQRLAEQFIKPRVLRKGQSFTEAENVQKQTAPC